MPGCSASETNVLKELQTSLCRQPQVLSKTRPRFARNRCKENIRRETAVNVTCQGSQQTRHCIWAEAMACHETVEFWVYFRRRNHAGCIKSVAQLRPTVLSIWCK